MYISANILLTILESCHIIEDRFYLDECKNHADVQVYREVYPVSFNFVSNTTSTYEQFTVRILQMQLQSCN